MKAKWTGFKSPLAEDIQRFLHHKRGLGGRYYAEESALRLLDRFLVQQGVKQIAQITPELLDAFLSSRPRNSPRSYNHLVGVLRRLFSWLIKQGYLDRSPLHAHIRPTTMQRLPFLFGPAEACRLLEHAARLKDNPRAQLRGPTYHTIFALLYGLGLRVGEVSRLCIADVNFNRCFLVIRQTKFGKNRIVPFGPRMEEQLKQYIKVRTANYGQLRPESPLFSFDGTRSIHPGTVSQTFHTIFPQLGLQVPDGVCSPCVHDLRHSFAVGTLLRWYRTGINPGARLIHLATFLGHVNPSSTAVYLTITSELFQEANSRFEKIAALTLQEVPE